MSEHIFFSKQNFGERRGSDIFTMILAGVMRSLYMVELFLWLIIVSMGKYMPLHFVGINNKGQCGREFPVVPTRNEQGGAEGEDLSDHEQDLDAESVIPG